MGGDFGGDFGNPANLRFLAHSGHALAGVVRTCWLCQASLNGLLLAAIFAGAAHFHHFLFFGGEFGLEAAEFFAQLGGVSAG